MQLGPIAATAAGTYAGRSIFGRGTRSPLMEATSMGIGGVTGLTAFQQATDNPYGFSYPTFGAIAGAGAGTIRGLRSAHTSFYQSVEPAVRESMEAIPGRLGGAARQAMAGEGVPAASREVGRVMEEVYGTLRASNVQKFAKPVLSTTMKGGLVGLAAGTAIYGLGMLGSSMRQQRHMDNLNMMPGFPV